MVLYFIARKYYLPIVIYKTNWECVIEEWHIVEVKVAVAQVASAR